MTALRERALRVTTVLVAASALLIPPGVLDIGGSWPMVGALVLLAGGLFVIRDVFSQFPTILGIEAGEYLPDIWLAPVVASGALVVVGPSVSPGELQALGGLAGLVGVVNYLLRPVYVFFYGIGRRVLQAV